MIAVVSIGCTCSYIQVVESYCYNTTPWSDLGVQRKIVSRLEGPLRR